jgi:hypothetical protein
MRGRQHEVVDMKRIRTRVLLALVAFALLLSLSGSALASNLDLPPVVPDFPDDPGAGVIVP